MADEDILARLLESERASNELVREAQAEADGRIREAVAASEAAFKLGWEKSAKALEDSFREHKDAVAADFLKRAEDYARSLEALPEDRDALARVVMDHLERGR